MTLTRISSSQQDSPLDGFPPPRYEIKYHLPRGSEESLRRLIRSYVSIDPYSREGRYGIRSVYLDTPSLDAYFDKVHGLGVRKKLRLRAYDTSSPGLVFAEIKRRWFDKISKDRCLVSLTLLQELLDGRGLERIARLPTREEQLALSRWIYLVKVKRLRPMVYVHYDREAYLGMGDERIRVTLDTDVRGRPCTHLEELFDDGGLRRVETLATLLECKFDHVMPGWMLNAVRSLGLYPVSCSKYCDVIDAWGLTPRAGFRRPQDLGDAEDDE